MNIGIIGCGLMGRARANAVRKTACGSLTAVCDADAERAFRFSEEFQCEAASQPADLLADERIDAVVVAVPHFLSHSMTAAALAAGKHVLCEKPVGMTSAECRDLIARRRPGQVLAAGFNYRFYPGVRMMRSLIDEGLIGPVTHMRLVLGHGGRPGMEAEWKTSKKLCGGGALLDPGIHMLDLASYLGGRIEGLSGMLTRTFWPVDVEDNAFLNVRTDRGVHAQMHISITEWKSRMAIDVFGSDGCLRLRGRSGFYGPQVLHCNPRWEWLSPGFRERVIEFPPEDVSFEAEMLAFAELIHGRMSHELGTAEDCCRLLDLIEECYATTTVHTNTAAVAVAG